MAEENKKVEEVTEATTETKIEEETKTEETPTKEEEVLEKEDFIAAQLKKDIPEIRAGDMVKVYQKIKDKNKERVQVFEGQVLFAKHGKEIGATITVRKVLSGIGVERDFPIHSPLVEKIEVVKKLKARRAKLYYLRERLREERLD
jgi:large subunit ribosomal protein L19